MNLVFFDKYSVIPKYFFFKKVFFEIGPLIKIHLFFFFFNIFKDLLKQFFIYLFDFIEILENIFFIFKININYIYNIFFCFFIFLILFIGNL